MARRTLFLLPLAVLFAGSILAAAQSASTAHGQAEGSANTQPGQLGSSTDSIAHITLGQSAVPLYGPWKFTVGDSPIDPKTGQPLWAEPDFDDSQWESVDLKPPTGIFDPANPNTALVPGWRAKGHPDYWGWAWYRLTVPLAENSQNLALAGPATVEAAYQVFMNGDLVGSMGKFDEAGKAPTIYSYQPAMFLLPQAPSSGVPTGHEWQQVLTFRVWSPSWLDFPGEGGIHAAPLLGEAGSIRAEVRLEWLARIRVCGDSLFEGFVLFLLAIVAASLILFNRSDKVYLVVASVLFVNASLDLLFSLTNLTTLLDFTTYVLLLECFFLPLMMGGWMLVWWIWFRLSRPAWVPIAIALLTAAFSASQALGGNFFIGAVPHSLAVFSHAASVAVRLLFLPLMALIVVLGIRKEGREAWLALAAF